MGRFLVLNAPPRHVVVNFIFRIMRCAKCCNLNDLSAKAQMNYFEAAPDDSSISKQGLELLRRRIGGYVEVLRAFAEQ